MPDWLVAALSGLLAGGTLVVGAMIAWFLRVPKIVTAVILAFGAGVLISALAFDLVQEAVEAAGLLPTVLGFLGGAVVYVAANATLDRLGRRSRDAGGEGNTGGGIAVGALLDGVPESAVLGLTIASGGAVSVPLLAAIAISNLPEGLGSTAEMREGGRSARQVFTLWGAIALACAVTTVLGFLFLGGLPPTAQAVTQAIAAGAILAMICDTMIPDAFRTVGAFNGLAATVGFLLSFLLHAAS